MLSLRLLSPRVAAQSNKYLLSSEPRVNSVSLSSSSSSSSSGVSVAAAASSSSISSVAARQQQFVLSSLNKAAIPSSIFQEKMFFMDESAKFSRSFSSSPAPHADLQQVIKKSHIDTQEAEISKMIESQVTEIDAMPEFQEYKQTLMQLTEAGVKIAESEEGVAVLRSDNNGRSIKIEWDPSVLLRLKQNASAEEDGQGLEAGAERNAQDEGSYEEANEEQDGEHDHDHDHNLEGAEDEIELKVTITKDGKTLYANASIANDGLLYIYQFGIAENKLVEVEMLSEEFQQRLYDYFDGVGIGDSTSNFIIQYNTFGHLKRNIDNLNLVREQFL